MSYEFTGKYNSDYPHILEKEFLTLAFGSGEPPLYKFNKFFGGFTFRPFEIGLQILNCFLNIFEATQCFYGFIQSGFIVIEKFALKKIAIVQY